MYNINEINECDKDEIFIFFKENWRSSTIVSRGKVHDGCKLPGFIVKKDKNIIGLITYNIIGIELEIVSLDSIIENQGIGSMLIKNVIYLAKNKGCNRIWLITTNDNTDALRFYQKRGFDISDLHINTIEKSRKIKPEIPKLGFCNIPIKHEIELEYILK